MIDNLDNVFAAISTYADMSPDLEIRTSVNRQLTEDREDLSFSDWCDYFSSQRQDRRALAFIYRQFGEYTGLNMGRVRPGDQLIETLQLPLICWFDWTTTFYCDFYEEFQLDLSDCFDETAFSTFGELVSYLVAQVATRRFGRMLNRPAATRAYAALDHRVPVAAA